MIQYLIYLIENHSEFKILCNLLTYFKLCNSPIKNRQLLSIIKWQAFTQQNKRKLSHRVSKSLVRQLQKISVGSSGFYQFLLSIYCQGDTSIQELCNMPLQTKTSASLQMLSLSPNTLPVSKSVCLYHLDLTLTEFSWNSRLLWIFYLQGKLAQEMAMNINTIQLCCTVIEIL